MFASIVLHALDSTISLAAEESFHHTHFKGSHSRGRGGGKPRIVFGGVAGFFEYFLPASNLTSFKQEEGTHKPGFGSRDQRGTWLRLRAGVGSSLELLRHTGNIIAPVRTSSCGAAFRGTPRFIWSYLHHQFAQFQCHAPRGAPRRMSSLLNTHPAPREAEVNFCSCNWFVPN